ncbi:ABC transporter ATP-binding protein [Nitrobacter sp. NHB1]|uniref:ABC transporter ATP-binding protein n=1 Tax=Nitrobacter sp. NHB1 TaxID=3119830 RepID=UPI002FFDFA79
MGIRARAMSRTVLLGTSLTSRLRGYRDLFTLVWRFAQNHHGKIALFVFLAVFSVVTESFGVFLLIPLLQSMGHNNLFANVPVLGSISGLFDGLPAASRLLWAGGLMLVVVLIRGALQFAQEFLSYSIPLHVDSALRIKAFRGLIGTSMQYVDTIGAGEISNIIVGHSARIGIAVRFFATLISSIFILLCYVVVLSIVSPFLFLLAGIYILVTTLLFRAFTTNIVRSVGTQLSRANQQFSQIFFETLNGAKLIRLSGATGEVQQDLESSVRILNRARDRTVAIENMTVPYFNTIGGILICVIVMAVGVLKADTAASAIGVIVIFFVLLLRIVSPLSVINISRNNILVHLDAFQEYQAFLSACESAQETDGSVILPNFQKAVSFEGVSFSYSTDGPVVLKDVSFTIPHGHMVAIVGPSGSGKSTIVNLLARLYRPNSGSILIDGTPLNDLVVESWWRRLGVVTQDIIVINGSIRANLCFGLREEVSLDRLKSAASLASIDDWISSLPDGYDTMLGDRGGRLSGGQRQRLALARAFIRDPEIIVLDEATSALDTLTEQTIQKQLSALSRRKTVIAIAHRLSTVRLADTIIVVDRGCIAEVGSHNELLKRQGIYSRMIESQSLDLVEDDGET